MTYNHLVVPDDPKENAEWRAETLRLAEGKHPNAQKFRQQIMERCRKDFWYWANGFSFVHEPRILDDDAEELETKIPFCIAAGTLVVTDRGPVPIEAVTPNDLVWDGDFWVSQGGALCMGRKSVVLAYDVYLTKDHRVWTDHGWKMACEGYDRASVRLPDGYRTRWGLSSENRPSREVALPVPVRKESRGGRGATAERQDKELRMPEGRSSSRPCAKKPAVADLLHLDSDVAALRESQSSLIAWIRWPWNQSVRAVEAVYELLKGHGRQVVRNDTGANQQRRQLRTRELSLGHTAGTGKQQEEQYHYGYGIWPSHSVRVGSNVRNSVPDPLLPCTTGLEKSETPWTNTLLQEANVYDLLNCGLKQAFTVLDAAGHPLLAHNCPWPHQIPVVNQILACLGKRDVRVVKSRAQGASWILVLVFTWCWLFKRGFKGNIVSKDEIAVDRRGDTDSIFGKIDLLISWLPTWMVGVKNKQWRRNYADHYLAKMDGQTAITGFACTGDVASGGRATVFGLDEHAKHPQPADRQALAATQPITRCRIFISTPKGKGGAYYDIVHDATIEEPVLYLSWRDNPTQNSGLYRIVRGHPIPVNEEKYGPLPAVYTNHEYWTRLKERLQERGYDLTSSNTRSPWYDQECLRPGANPVIIAQEYDMVFGSEGAQYFSEALINRMKASVRRPVRGELGVNSERLTGRWAENPEGRFRLWCDLDNSHHPPMGEYVVGCDICAGIGGSGSSNSAMTVFNRRTGAKVASFASPAVLPYDFAEIAIATCRFFMNYKGDPAFLIWEANGHGEEFRIRVERSDFMYYYHRKPSDSAIFARDTAKAGYWTQKRSKLLGPYREALLEGFFEDPEYESVEELREYQMGQDGEPFHVGENNKEDPAGAKGAHGDRIVANALVWHASLTFGDQQATSGTGKNINVNNVRESLVPAGSAAWRRARYLDSMRKEQTSRW